MPNKRTEFQNEAWKRWPDSDWVAGDGPFASVARCRNKTVILFKSQEAAEKAKSFIDQMACGGLCERNHSVVDLRST